MFKNLFPKSEFSRSVITLMTGTTVAQAIPVAITPILTRIYSPEDFGVLALFMSIAILFGNISNARYELAIMKPLEELEALEVAKLSLLICTIFSLILAIVVVIFHSSFVFLLKSESLSSWLYFIPIIVFFLGLFNVLNYYNIRRKNYRDISKANVLKSASLGFFQLTLPFLVKGNFGLLMGYMASTFLGNLKLFKSTFPKTQALFDIDANILRGYAIKYKEFPQYTLPAAIANSVSQQFSNVLISSVFSVKTLGFYSLSQRLLAMPLSLIARSIGQVFFQKSSECYNSEGSALSLFKSTVFNLILVGLPIFSLMFFTVKPVFTYIFGSEWAIAGVYSKILTPLFFARFLVTPISTLNVVYKKNKIGFLWQSGLLIIQFVIIFVSYFWQLDFLIFLMYFSLISSAYYFLLLFIVYNYVKEIKV